ncbi:hypothetical protein BFC18_06760 [Alteromonas confluentis]|uniref:diguanylate cyclase n=1 Tax=Alteromonas confluentis TaxID=1656094 RepID=A0A1E7ZEC2_9ALTE|nr:hypothetical protein BFC18_06760 [Alteromonas confluentis]
MALSDWDTAKVLLADLDEKQLSGSDRDFYDYLSIYFTTKDIPFETLSENYKRLYDKLPPGEARIKLAKSLLSLSAHLSEWDYAFALSKDVEQQLETIDDPNLLAAGWKGMLVFYNTAGLRQQGESMVKKILNSTVADSKLRCFARTMRAEMNLEVNKATELQFNDAIDNCKRAGETFFIAFNFVHLLDFYVTTAEYNKARIIEREAQWRVDELKFAPLSGSFLLSQAEMRLGENRIDEAEALAIQSINSNSQGEYKQGVKGAYRILIDIYQGRKDYEKAYQYLLLKQEIEALLTSEQSIRELAYQKATFDVKAKENEILLLDKQNKLLQAEALYSGQKMKTTMLALAMVSVVGVALLFWSYRSRKLTRKLRYLATRDSLTGLYNRGFFSEKAVTLLTQAQKSGQPVSMLLLDLDLFKSVNDTYGHQVGDWVLREVAASLLRVCPKEGIVTRMGGEEFGLIVTGLSAKDSFQLAERCRQDIEKIDSSISGHKFKVSASFGVSTSSQVGYSLDNLFSASDLALYQSKRFGRNQVYEYNSNLTQFG